MTTTSTVETPAADQDAAVLAGAAKVDTGKSLIHLEGLTKVFETEEVETHALSSIHLDIQKGEWVAIVGP
ncbi:ABC transporter ATP-binding protein, partial [Myxococcus sp. K15C18031901]|nr:ABC transporter ATP-binding protein [Myxococcus dinghuensis]